MRHDKSAEKEIGAISGADFYGVFIRWIPKASRLKPEMLGYGEPRATLICRAAFRETL